MAVALPACDPGPRRARPPALCPCGNAVMPPDRIVGRRVASRISLTALHAVPQSLNLSVASAICLNEITRQRMTLAGGNERWSLPAEQQERLAADLHQRRRGCALYHFLLLSTASRVVRAGSACGARAGERARAGQVQGEDDKGAEGAAGNDVEV